MQFIAYMKLMRIDKPIGSLLLLWPTLTAVWSASQGQPPLELVIIFIFGDHGLFQLYKLKKERKEVQEHITQLRENREILVAEKNRLENDLEYIEKLAREKYRMAKPGEKVFKVIPKKESDDIKKK